MSNFWPIFSYVTLFALLPLIFTTTKTVSRRKLRDKTFVKTLLKDYLRTFPAISLVMIPVLLWPKITPWYAVAIHLIFALPEMLELGHVHNFKTRVGLNTFYSLFVSNVRETKEFFAQNVSWMQLALMFLFTFGPLPFLAKLPVPEFTSQVLRFGLLAIAIFLVALFVKNLLRNPIKRKDGYVMNPYTNLIFHYFLFRRNYRELQRMIAEHAAPPFEGIASTVTSDENETYVIVIGESANSQHCAYCGYARETNEFTDKFGEALLRFKGVRSPFAQTIPSLEKVLTFADNEHPEKIYSMGSIIDYFNDAGFDTYWYSNQYALDDTALTAMTSHAKVSRCFNFSGMKRFEKAGLDGDMLPEIEKLFAREGKKKAIFIHLIGSHSAYVNRYPDEFRHFEGQAPRKNLSDDKAQILNTYDDSIRYTDWVISEIIKQLDKVAGRSFMLYFSDHGEDIYDTSDTKILGHSQLANLPMTSVPFMLWLSKAYEAVRPDVRERAAKAPEKYNLISVIHTIIDLASLTGAEYEKSQSILP